MRKVLAGIKAVDLSTALPGPLAASRLAEMGAAVTKIEPPQGDLLSQISPDWYTNINQSKRIRRLDLKTNAGQIELADELTGADLLLMTMRPGALKRLALDPESLGQRFPQLNCVAIVGLLPPLADQSGHDLTYQALAGLLEPPHVPRFLLADLMGAELAVQAALALLFHRQREGVGGWEWVSLVDAARVFRPVLDFGLTASDQILGGGDPRYGYYRAQDGWIALAALEERLWWRFLQAVGRLDLKDRKGEPLAADLRHIFASRTSKQWQDLGLENHLPVQAVTSSAGILACQVAQASLPAK